MNVFRLASYNIRKTRGLDQKRDPNRTIDVINGLDAHVVVLQEADRRFGARIAALPHAMIEAETDFRVVDVSDNAVSLGWHGNAMLVRKTTPVASVERITLPGFEPRGAVRVGLGHRGEVSVVALHLGLRRSDRRAQLAAVCAVAQDHARTVIAGDFNEWSPRRGLEPLAGHFQMHAPGLSFHARRPMAALDRVALGANLQLQGAGVDESKLAKRASDHLPIWADIEVSAA